MNPVALDDGRPVWTSARAFVLTVMGGSAGFACFFRLPVMFVAFGVGNFAIPYFLSLVIVAYPMATLEIFLGQHHRKASAGTLAAIHPRAVGIGYAMPVIASAVIAVYTSVILAWTVYPFLIQSFAKDAPYDFSTPGGTRKYWRDRGVFTGGNPEVFVVLAAVWVAASLLAMRGIRSVMVAVYFTVPLPLCFLLGLMVYACVVADGANLSSALAPTVSGVFNLPVWGNALGQALLTVQATTGNLVAFGSFCRPVHNSFRIGTAVLFQAVLLAVTFGVTTACAMTLLDWNAVGDHGVWAGFFVPLGVYSSLLARTAVSGPLAIFFFACVILLGLENVATAVQVLYSILWDFAVRLRGRKLGLLIWLGAFALSAPLMLEASYNTITAIDQAVVAIAMPLLAVFEAIAIGYCWADKSILATLAERPTADGWSRFKALVSIAFHQSVGKIHDLIEAQGRHSRLASVMPVFVKLIVPALCLVSCVGSAVNLARDASVVGVAGAICALVVVVVTLVFVGVGVVLAKPKEVPMPWSTAVTMDAVEAVGSPTEGRAVGPISADTMELRAT